MTKLATVALTVSMFVFSILIVACGGPSYPTTTQYKGAWTYSSTTGGTYQVTCNSGCTAQVIAGICDEYVDVNGTVAVTHDGKNQVLEAPNSLSTPTAAGTWIINPDSHTGASGGGWSCTTGVTFTVVFSNGGSVTQLSSSNN